MHEKVTQIHKQRIHAANYNTYVKKKKKGDRFCIVAALQNHKLKQQGS
jgi:hypothetical protein